MDLIKAVLPDYQALFDQATRDILSKYLLTYVDLKSKCPDYKLRKWVEDEDIESIKECSQLYLVVSALLTAWLASFRQAADTVSKHIIQFTGNSRFRFDEFDFQNTLLVDNSRHWIEDTINQHIDGAIFNAVVLSRKLPKVDRINLVRSAIGLTANQVQILNRYRLLLQARSPEAIVRRFRDEHLDSQVLRGTLTPERLREMVTFYASNMLRDRAEDIANVIASDAVYVAGNSVIEQAILAGVITSSLVTNEWHTRGDSRVRHSHQTMNRQKRAWGEPFVSGSGNRLMYPRDRRAPVSEVAGCRCWLSWYFG